MKKMVRSAESVFEEINLYNSADSKFQRMRSVEECKSPRRRRVHRRSEGDQTEEDNLSLHSAGSMLSLQSEAEDNVPKVTEMVREHKWLQLANV